jgi:hypothetical protein
MRSLCPLSPAAAAAALSLVVLAGLTACSGKDEPTVAEAGAQLQQAVQRLYDKQLGRGDPSVSSDAGANQACGDGRAKRVYAATVRTRGFSDRPAAFDYAVGVIEDIGSGWERQSTRNSSDTVTSAGVDGHARLSVTTSQDGKSYSVAGETDCLPTG